MVTKAQLGDLEQVVRLALLMWPSHTKEDLAEEFSGLLQRADARIFLKREGELPVGFAECSLRRDYVEGAQNSPVGYLEGVFVEEGYRRRGYAGELLAECEKWAAEKGCREFASDCELLNRESRDFHQAMHFSEANCIICFIKKL